MNQERINKYFSETNGFNEYKPMAIDLLKQTINFLNEFNVSHFLISGTLLGQVRHNDFIPWDDDMDLLVDNTIIGKLPEIVEKHKNINLMSLENRCVKVWLMNEGIPIVGKRLKVYTWKKYTQNTTYRFPFIDLFPYEENPMKFFGKTWDIDKFYPPKEVDFLDIKVNIPNNPDYFLKINYGINYMTKLKSSDFSHREDKCVNSITIESKKHERR